MNKTGPAAASLTDRLQQSVEKQRQQIEAATQNELEQLVSNLRQSSTDAVNGLKHDLANHLSIIEREVKTRTTEISRDLNAIRHKPKTMIMISVLITALTTAVFWTGPTLWTMWRLQSVTVQKTETGTYLILPMTAETGWRCDNNPCVKLED